MDTKSKSPRITEIAPHRPLLAVNLLHSIVTPAIDLIHNSSAIAVFHFGMSLAKEQGLKLSLSDARCYAKAHAITSCFYCALNSAFTNFTILNGNLSVVSTVLAGCCTGVFGTVTFGSPYSGFYNCISFSIRGVVDLALNSRHRFVSKIPSTFINFGTYLVRKGFVENAMKHIVVTTTIVSIIKKGANFELWEGVAPDLVEFSALTLSLLASSTLLLFGLHYKKNVLSAGAFGCWTSLLNLPSFDGPKGVLFDCFEAGLLFETFKAMYSRGAFFVRLPPLSKLYDRDVLPPFTLLLPQDIEDGFSAFHDALRKNTKKS